MICFLFLRLPEQLFIAPVVQDSKSCVSFSLIVWLLALLVSSGTDILLLDFRGTMKRLGCITWHLSRKLIRPTNLCFLTMVGNINLSILQHSVYYWDILA